nr:hypothetical protein [Tanacetum cinerariifolium]
SQELPSTSQVIPTPPPSPISQPPSPQQQPQTSQPSHDAEISMDLLHTLLETYVQGKQAESQVQTYKIDLEHADKVLSIQDDELEPTELQEVVKVVTTSKLITKVVTAASATITAATTLITAATLNTAPSAARRRKEVVTRDHEETATPSSIIHSEPKSKYKGKVQRKEKEDNAMMRYQALKRKPQTEAQAGKNMMVYLRNMAGFKMDYLKGMSYDDIRLIFDNLQPAFQFEECPSPKRRLSLTTGNFSNPGMDYLISMHTRSNVRLSALVYDSEEKSSVPPLNFSFMILQENYVEFTYLLKGDKMADVNAPSDQTPTMAPPIRADDQILPHIRWIPIGKSNCYLDLEKSQSNPIYKIAEPILITLRGSGRNLPNPYILLLKTNGICLGIHQGKKGHSDCDSKRSVHQADHPPPSEEAQGTKREVFGMPIPGSLITADIREASYYQEYQTNVAKHRWFLASEIGTAQDSHAPKSATPARKPKPTAQKAQINILLYLIHLRMCKDFQTKC